MFDILLKNGTVVTAEKEFSADVAINGDKIAQVAPQIDAPAAKVIDLSGKYIIPGVIDGHIHCMCPFMGCTGPNDFYKTSISAAFGGVTTFIDFTNSKVGVPVHESALEKLDLISMSAINYSLHAKVVESTPESINDIQKLVDMGLPTFKMFMTYKKDGIMCDDETLIKAFKKSVECGALPLLHCESDAMAQSNIDDYIANGDELTWARFAQSKPPICEAEAFIRAYYYAKSVNCAIMAVHTTVKDAFDTARRAHEEDFPLYLETCPSYVSLFKDIYDREDGYLAICSPPLRTESESEYIWQAMQDGTINITGSDDCTYTKEEKSRFLKKDENGRIIQDFTAVVNGNSGLETRLPILLSDGVMTGRISLSRLVQLTSTNIAKIYGCYPQKGTIAEGADADLVILDLNKSWTVTKDSLHNNLDYCLYDDKKINGSVDITICNGNIIVENGEFKGKRGDGRFVKRVLDPKILSSYSAL